MNDQTDFEFAVIQLHNGRFFCVNHSSSSHVRSCLNFGPQADAESIHRQLKDICLMKGIPVPVDYKIRRVKARLMD